MSAYIAGRISQEVARSNELKGARDDAGGDTAIKKAAALAQRVAALLPADILAIYGIVLAASTEKADDGSTQITNPTVLKWSVPVLMATGLALFLIGKGKREEHDWLRALIPALAFAVWALLSGTNGLVLWKWFDWLTGGMEFLVAGPLAALLIGASARLNPTP